jgi:PAS domain S-box-containing protein
MPKTVALEHDYYLEKYVPGQESSVVGKRRVVDAIRKDGTVFPLEVSVEEVWINEEVTYIGLLQDITARVESEKAVRESQQLLQTILDNMPMNVFVRDVDGRYLLANKSYAESHDGLYAESLDRVPAELIGKTPRDIFAPEIASEFMDSDAVVFREGEVIELEEVLFAGGEEKTLLVVKFPIYDLDGNITSLGGIDIDITDRKRAEKEIAAAKDVAEEATRAKSAFLANMSHELRTPMNAIIGYSEMLAEDAEDDGLDEMLEDLQKITAAGKHLLSLINDVLDLSKIEAGRMDLYLEKFELRELVSDVSSTAISLIEKNSNELIVNQSDDIGEMVADTTKIRQILFNLISNAAKFTENGTVTLSVDRVVEDEESMVQFAVSDTGIGIPSEKLDHVFEEFSQADESTTKNYGGTGLGLALTKRFCDMMGGRVWLESEVGVGTTFFVALPEVVRVKHEGLEEEARVSGEMDIPPPTEEQPEHEPIVPVTPTATLKPGEPEAKDALDAAARSPTVLVVDDEANARDLIRRNLEPKGCVVVEAKNGKEALELAVQVHPDLITLDVMMPGMDGWTVLKRLKGNDAVKDIPVVMISMVGDKAISASLGAVDALQKPIDRNQLHAIVKRFANITDKNVLVVEDDEAARVSMSRAMSDIDWNVDVAENGQVALDKCADSRYSLILLDLMMPVMDGFEFLHHLRGNAGPSSGASVVVVTAKTLTQEDRAILMGQAGEIISKEGRDIGEILDEVRIAIEKPELIAGSKHDK